jgi:hypothetical protein
MATCYIIVGTSAAALFDAAHALVDTEDVCWANYFSGVWFVIDRQGRNAEWWSDRLGEATGKSRSLVYAVDSCLEWCGYFPNTFGDWLQTTWKHALERKPTAPVTPIASAAPPPKTTALVGRARLRLVPDAPDAPPAPSDELVRLRAEVEQARQEADELADLLLGAEDMHFHAGPLAHRHLWMRHPDIATSGRPLYRCEPENHARRTLFESMRALELGAQPGNARYPVLCAFPEVLRAAGLERAAVALERVLARRKQEAGPPQGT